MKQLLIILLTLLPLFANEWKSIKTKDGVIVHRRGFKQTRLDEAKGTATINAPIAVIVAIVEDVKMRTTWFDVYKSARELSSSNSSELFIHTVTNMPFPLKERESVWRRVVSYDTLAGLYVGTFYATTEKEFPFDGDHIRVTNGVGKWTLKAIDGQRTKVTYQFGCDPEGGIPSAFVNGVAKSIPVTTINAIRKAVESKHYDAYYAEN